MADRLTQKSIDKYTKVFYKSASKEDETIRIENLKSILSSLSIFPEPEELQMKVKEIDKNYQGKLNLQQFLEVVEFAEKNEENIMLLAFRAFDKQRSGFLPLEKFRFLLSGLKENLTEKEIDNLIQEAKVDEENKVDYQLCIQLLKQMELPC